MIANQLNFQVGNREIYMSTIKEVSKLANVSLMTVSRAINAPDTVSEKTLMKVKAAIEKLQYVPNLSAQRIRGSESAGKTIGILSFNASTTPFAVELLGSIEFFAKQSGWNTFTVHSSKNPPSKSCVAQLISHRPDAIIICSMLIQYVSIPDELRNFRIVLANCASANLEATYFIPNDEQGQYEATKAALLRGYKKPFMLSLPTTSYVYAARYKGFLRACTELKIKMDDTYHRSLESHDGYEEVISILADKTASVSSLPDLIVCGNDRIALLVYQYLMTKGFRIPADIAVLGYDNMIGMRGVFYPPLSTVQLPFFEIGKKAVRHLSEKNTDPREYQIFCPLILGNSL